MATRKPKIVYYWVVIKYPSRTKKPQEIVVNWRLVGANGELMCSSNQGYRDKTDAQRAVLAVAAVLAQDDITGVYVREVGPGKKPTTGEMK